MLQLLENVFIIVVFGIAIKYLVSLLIKKKDGVAGSCSSCTSNSCNTCPTVQEITEK